MRNKDLGLSVTSRSTLLVRNTQQLRRRFVMIGVVRRLGAARVDGDGNRKSDAGRFRIRNTKIEAVRGARDDSFARR